MPDTDERAARAALADDLLDQFVKAIANARAAYDLKGLHDWIFTARILVERLAALGERVELEEHLDLACLPTFGGDIPQHLHQGVSGTEGIWSWDPQSMLVGDCVSAFRIVPRVDA
jgi:hypothetical protein